MPPLASKTQSQQVEQTDEPFYKYYDETPDGVRTEAQGDPEEEELLEGLQEAVREIKERYLGKFRRKNLRRLTKMKNQASIWRNGKMRWMQR